MKVIKYVYHNPQFRITYHEGISIYRKQRAGIRQGRPLSPYLFMLLMTVMFHDVPREVGLSIAPHTNNCTNIWELLYADDTMVLGNRASEIYVI